MEEQIVTQERADSLFNATTLEQFKRTKAIIQKAAIWVFVGGVVLSALLLVFGGLTESTVLGRMVGTLMILALMLVVSIFDFAKIESGDKETQAFAFLGVVMNVFWALLWIGIIWEVLPFTTRDCGGGGEFITNYCSTKISILGKLAVISSLLSALGLFGAAVMGIKEYDKRSSIRPLKITAICCLVYEEVFYSILTLMNFDISGNELLTRLVALAGFTGFIWVVAAIIAALMSKSARNAKEYAKNKELLEKGRAAEAAEKASVATPAPAPALAAPKTDEELRAEIEEKVRREMIEKEVRERVEKEMAEKKAGEN